MSAQSLKGQVHLAWFKEPLGTRRLSWPQGRDLRRLVVRGVRLPMRNHLRGSILGDAYVKQSGRGNGNEALADQSAASYRLIRRKCCVRGYLFGMAARSAAERLLVYPRSLLVYPRSLPVTFENRLVQQFARDWAICASTAWVQVIPESVNGS